MGSWGAEYFRRFSPTKSTLATPDSANLDFTSKGTLQPTFKNMDDEEPKSIRELYRTAERLRNDLSNSPDSNNPAFQETLSTAIATYESCLNLSEQVSLFSPNETLDDVSSSDLQ